MQLCGKTFSRRLSRYENYFIFFLSRSPSRNNVIAGSNVICYGRVTWKWSFPLDQLISELTVKSVLTENVPSIILRNDQPHMTPDLEAKKAACYEILPLMDYFRVLNMKYGDSALTGWLVSVKWPWWWSFLAFFQTWDCHRGSCLLLAWCSALRRATTVWQVQEEWCGWGT